MDNWTDADRSKTRTYVIYSDGKLVVKLRGDLFTAHKFFNFAAHHYQGRRMALYADRRSTDNICIEETTNG